MPHALARRHTAMSLVEQLLDSPRLPAAVRALTPLEFAAAVQRDEGDREGVDEDLGGTRAAASAASLRVATDPRR